MPKIGYVRISFWSEKEKEQRNTKRHKAIKAALYKLALAGTSKERFAEKLKEFKEQNPDLIIN